MAELLDAVVAEHDAFLDGCARLHQDNGLAFVPPPFDPGPTASHPRLARCEKRNLTAPMRSLAFTDPPPPAEAMPPTAPDTGATSDAAPTVAPGPEKDALDVPGAANAPAPDTLPYPPEIAAKKASRPATILTGDVAGTDPDADTLPPDLDAEAPPDAGEKNPGIAADCA